MVVAIMVEVAAAAAAMVSAVVAMAAAVTWVVRADSLAATVQMAAAAE